MEGEPTNDWLTWLNEWMNLCVSYVILVGGVGLVDPTTTTTTFISLPFFFVRCVVRTYVFCVFLCMFVVVAQLNWCIVAVGDGDGAATITLLLFWFHFIKDAYWPLWCIVAKRKIPYIHTNSLTSFALALACWLYINVLAAKSSLHHASNGIHFILSNEFVVFEILVCHFSIAVRSLIHDTHTHTRGPNIMWYKSDCFVNCAQLYSLLDFIV